MKIIALTNPSPGFRYRAHISALKGTGIDLVCVSVCGLGLKLEKVRQHARILRKRGPVHYVKWQRMRRGAAPERAIVHGILEKELEGNSFLTEEIPIRRTFGGLSSELLRFIDAEKPTFLFQLGAGILPGRFIERTAPILNLHPGILPGIRGVEPLFWAHYYGKAEWFGTTLHYIDAGIDTGAPLIRKRFAPQKNEHYAFSVKRQIFVEQDLLRSFVSAYPHNVSALDEGGCEGSVYRTAWAKEHYHALEAANWWNAAPLEDRPKPSARPAGAGTNRI